MAFFILMAFVLMAFFRLFRRLLFLFMTFLGMLMTWLLLLVTLITRFMTVVVFFLALTGHVMSMAKFKMTLAMMTVTRFLMTMVPMMPSMMMVVVVMMMFMLLPRMFEVQGMDKGVGHFLRPLSTDAFQEQVKFGPETFDALKKLLISPLRHLTKDTRMVDQVKVLVKHIIGKPIDLLHMILGMIFDRNLHGRGADVHPIQVVRKGS